MDYDTLLTLGPDELAHSLLQRRKMLKESLPGVIRNLEAEQDSLTPRFNRFVNSFQKANERVAELKEVRDRCQAEAGLMVADVKAARGNLRDSGGLIDLDPKWKKEKLFEKLEDIELRIQTSALDQILESKMLDQRRRLLEENEKWLIDRKESNLEMSLYIEKRREMSKLYKTADKSHRNMLAAVEKAQPLFKKKAALEGELREIKSQLDRARELLSQSDKAIEHWKRRLSEGYGDLGPGFPDILLDYRRVLEGKPSSFARKSKKRSSRINDGLGGEEE